MTKACFTEIPPATYALLRGRGNPFCMLVEKAECLGKKSFEKYVFTSVVVGKNTGVDECHEVIVFIPWYINLETVEEVDNFLTDQMRSEIAGSVFGRHREFFVKEEIV